MQWVNNCGVICTALCETPAALYRRAESSIGEISGCTRWRSFQMKYIHKTEEGWK